MPGGNHPWARTERIVTGFTRGGAADLAIIADAWKCSKADVIWVVMATWLSEHRDRDVLKLPYRKVSKALLRRAQRFEMSKAEEEAIEVPVEEEWSWVPCDDDDPEGVPVEEGDDLACQTDP